LSFRSSLTDSMTNAQSPNSPGESAKRSANRPRHRKALFAAPSSGSPPRCDRQPRRRCAVRVIGPYRKAVREQNSGNAATQ
jgi:hypothetical protein